MDTASNEPVWTLAMRAVMRLGALAIPFIAAGRIDWPRGWIFVATFLVTIVAAFGVIRRKNPGLLRLRLKKVEATKPFDKVFWALYSVALLALLVMAGLDDGRFGWSALPLEWIWLGLVLHVAGMLPVTWAMATNPFLEATVRIQDERGHVAITSGPYRFVRHPMYTGIIVAVLGWPLVFGSLWAYVPASAVILLFVFRTAKEDQTLQDELAGYKDYCTRTHYRLAPGVW